MKINYTADSILELNQPFSEFINHFPSEEEALAYYKFYVARQYYSLLNEAPEVTCKIVWKKMVSKKRKTLFDSILRYYYPSAGWKDLTFETIHECSKNTYSGLRKRLVVGRVGRILCLLFGFNAVCVLGAMLMLFKEEHALFQEDPSFQKIILYGSSIAVVILTISVLAYPYFKKRSNPENLMHISKGFFVVDKVMKMDEWNHKKHPPNRVTLVEK